ncbi:hypothetical protein DPX16_3484 [Anabarilius grahami]|uniref:Uncharacterized protein n=1 Tax=Anabarilius grahami TaxID=495550 RepID=A0A3N0Y6M5_ANAGA|nr:hypothetical protein DPX16_3484 [Anabarilius grahami]
MQRFAAGVTTEAHPLYRIFMARLSMCIFQWDQEDVAALRHAKEGELAAKKTGHISEKAVSARFNRRELALHCRRRIRGVEETTRLIGSLIDLFDNADGKNTLDHEWIQQIWKDTEERRCCCYSVHEMDCLREETLLVSGRSGAQGSVASTRWQQFKEGVCWM